MSAESTLVFYGARFEIGDAEITALEERSHPLVVAARRQSLKYYWGDFAPRATRHLLFIGYKLALLGQEGDRLIEVSRDDLITRIQETDARLARAGITSPAKLYMAWQPDK